MKKILLFVLTLLLVILSAFSTFAHPGRTDSSGGHYDNSAGEYHYHHGYSAHQHENGECPYDSSYTSEYYAIIEEDNTTTTLKPTKQTIQTTTQPHNEENVKFKLSNLIKKHPIISICITVFLIFLFSILFCNAIGKSSVLKVKEDTDMYNDEIEKIKLPSGYNVDISVDSYDNHYCNFTESQFLSFNNFINAGLYYPQIVQYVAVIVAILNGRTSFKEILLCNLIGGIVFTLTWFWGHLYTIPALAFVSCLIGSCFFRFFLHYIVIAVIAFFVVKDWKVLLFCAISGIITSIIKTLLSARLSTVKYHDRVVRYVSGFKHKQ